MYIFRLLPQRRYPLRLNFIQYLRLLMRWSPMRQGGERAPARFKNAHDMILDSDSASLNSTSQTSEPPETKWLRASDSAKRSQSVHLAEKLVDFLPRRPRRPLGTLLRQQVTQIQVAATRLQIHHANLNEWCTPVYLVRKVVGNHDWRRQIGLKEVPDQFPGGKFAESDRGKAGPELGDEDEDVEAETDKAAPVPRLRSER